MTEPAKEPEFDKRLVLHVQTGPYAGLRQINGTVSQLKAAADGMRLPEFLSPVSCPPDQRLASASLVAFKRTHVLYKECAAPR